MQQADDWLGVPQVWGTMGGMGDTGGLPGAGHGGALAVTHVWGAGEHGGALGEGTGGAGVCLGGVLGDPQGSLGIWGTPGHLWVW